MNRLLLSLLIVCVIGLQANGQESCNDVLVAAYNTLNINSQKTASSAARDWFCSDKFFSDIKNSSGGLSIGILIDGVPISFGFNSTDQSSIQKREQFCSDQRKTFTNDEALTIFKHFVNDVTVKAWEACMLEKVKASKRYNISLESQEINNDIFVTAKYSILSESDRDKHPLIMEWYTSNVENVRGAWVESKEVTVQGLLQQFKRIDPNKDVMISITTTQGVSENLIIKGKSYPLKIGDIRASWDEPVVRDAPAIQFDKKKTNDHHCSHNCQGEPTRTKYNLTLTAKDRSGKILGPDDGYFQAAKLECLSGPCGGWNSIINAGELRNNNSTVYAEWDVWSRPTEWKLSALWTYNEKWRANSEERALNRGDQFMLEIPKNAKNAKISGTTLKGDFEYSIDDIQDMKDSGWLIFEKSNEFGDFKKLYFKVLEKLN